MDKKVLIRSCHHNHVSMHAVAEFEREIASRSGWVTIEETKNRKAYKLLRKIWSMFPILYPLISLFFQPFTKKGNYFAVLMGIVQVRRTFPQFLNRKANKSIYLFDCWESQYKRVRETLNRLKIQTVFFSAKQSAAYFKKEMPHVHSFWLPEGISNENYFAESAEKKDIDLLQIGRRHPLFHDAIKEACEQNKIKYLYERAPGQLVFSNQRAFYSGLARTKISVCFPASMTHPEVKGSVSTMTRRYLESMLSKCLILGSAPEEMKALFDYQPVIEVDFDRPFQQLEELLSNLDQYKSLIEQNYNEVLKNHLWKNRMDKIDEVWQFS